ncbi:hypothetical protein AB0L06_30665 [Spirillospora sp. NPDC052269]
MSGVQVSRISLGSSPGPDKNYSFGMAGAAAGAVFVVPGAIWLFRGSSNGLLLLALGAMIGGFNLVIGVRGLRSRAAAASPAALDSEGFDLGLDGQTLRVPWQQVDEVLIIRQKAGSQARDAVVMTSLVAVLDADSPLWSEPLVERFARVTGLSDCVWLGEITTATRSMDVVLTAVREWVGERFDGNIREHSGW